MMLGATPPGNPRSMPHWLLPLVYTLVSIVSALVLPRVEQAIAAPISLGVSPAAALTVLSAIASGMMGLTAIVFSVAFVMVQFSAVTYSPRVALRFARDPVTFHALGMFFATFTYALATIAWVDRNGSGHVPALSWLVVILLLFSSLVCFTLMMQRLTDLQVTSMLRSIGDSGRAVIATTFPPGRVGPDTAAGTAAAAPAVQVLRHVGPPRYVQRFEIAPLVELARQSGGCIAMTCAVGDTLADGAVMLRLHGGAPIAEAALRAGVRLGLERTVEQDPKYPLRLLVDIAIKALSPAINDPTTAVQAIDQIEDLLRRLARVTLRDGAAADAAGVLRLTWPMPDWDDYLALGFDEIRVFGATSVQVLRRLRAALMGLDDALGEDPRGVLVRAYLGHLDGMIRRSAFDEEDRRRAVQEDPQGLGMARD